MKGDEIQTILGLKDRLQQRVLGQTHALAMIGERIQISRARLEDPRKPIGVFMLVGPSGVGKTETALSLAETLYGGEQNLITINMSEYQEAHTVSSLKGSPPGYVGYGEGGVLTEAVRRKPYSVVLWTRSRRPTATCSNCSSRCSTKACSRTARGARSISRTPSFC